MDPAHALLGSWQLQSWTLTDDRGVNHPFGDDATGLIMYTADGRMSAIVSANHRTDLPGTRPSDASEAELAAAFRSFFCYAGRWRIEDDTVVHTVELALNPNTLGTEQRRVMTFAGDTLELSAHEPTTRGVRQHRLRWRRC